MKLNQIEKFINELVYNNNQQILNDVYEIIKNTNVNQLLQNNGF